MCSLFGSEIATAIASRLVFNEIYLEGNVFDIAKFYDNFRFLVFCQQLIVSLNNGWWLSF